MTSTSRVPFLVLATIFAAALPVGAASAQGAASVEAGAAAPAPAPEPAPAAAPEPAPARETRWIERYRPVRNSWELGIYGGAFLPSPRHEFYAPKLDQPDFGHQPLARAGFDLGARVGYYPLSFLGLELEGGVIPMKVADGTNATLYTFRPVALFQLPYRIAPFVRGGFGMVGISSPGLGKDLDPSFNIGGGVKFYVNRLLVLRLDIVDNVATARGIGNARSNNLEVLLGLSLRLGRKEAEPQPRPAEPPPPRKLIDSDGDGLYDPGQDGVLPADVDACPQEPGPRDNRGCPLRDTDGDGLFDPGQPGVPAGDIDSCHLVPGPRENRGCPLLDTDADGMYDPGQPVAAADTDQCPREPGPRELMGCPDRDGDKVADRVDQCPDVPETINQVNDSDGCPDEVPKQIQKLSGVLRGIFFDVDKDTIKAKSKPTLEKAYKVLTDFPDTRWRIEGHTDSDGDHDHNMDLSQRRAEAVRNYLIQRGIDPSRLESKGFGPDEPLDSNDTAAGKARNRRIEFKLID
jgi:outer membrane protein OmpA-like peptidoglycan-associated protein